MIAPRPAEICRRGQCPFQVRPVVDAFVSDIAHEMIHVDDTLIPPHPGSAVGGSPIGFEEGAETIRATVYMSQQGDDVDRCISRRFDRGVRIRGVDDRLVLGQCPLDHPAMKAQNILGVSELLGRRPGPRRRSPPQQIGVGDRNGASQVGRQLSKAGHCLFERL